MRAVFVLCVSSIAIACGSADPETPAPEPTPAPEFGGAAGELSDRRLVLGDGWTCALSDDRKVNCIGVLPFEPDEDGLMVTRPIHAFGALRGAVEIAGGARVLCARDGAGRVACAQPEGIARLEALDGASSLGAASNVVCAGYEDGHVRCARDGALEREITRGVEDAIDVRTVGEAHVCARRREHPIACWGGDAFSIREQTEDGASAPPAIANVGGRPCPIDASGAVTCAAMRVLPFEAVAFESQGARACGIDREGVLRCLRGPRQFEVVPGEGRALELRVAERHSCVRREGDVLECWGDDHHGQSSGTPPPAEAEITAVRGLPPALDVALATDVGCALDAAGALRCWTAADREAHLVVAPALASLAAVRGAVCGRTTSGEVRCVRSEAMESVVLAGVDAGGALTGDERASRLVAVSRSGAVSLASVPQVARGTSTRRPLAALQGATDIALVEGDRACGVRGGRLVCAGPAEGGAEGVESEPAIDEVARFFAGGGARFVVRSDGSVWAWGQSFGGMLGLPPDDALAETPARVAELERPGRMVASSTASCAFGEHAPLVCAGVLLAGPTALDERESFLPLPGVGGVRAVALSGSAGCVVDAEGVTACWGEVRADGHARRIATPTRVAMRE